MKKKNFLQLLSALSATILYPFNIKQAFCKIKEKQGNKKTKDKGTNHD